MVLWPTFRFFIVAGLKDALKDQSRFVQTSYMHVRIGYRDFE